MAGGAEIKFEFDQFTVKNVERRLGRLKSRAPQAMKWALNDTARQARTDLGRKAQETYAVKIRGLTKQIRLQPANVGKLEAVLRVSGGNLPLTQKNFSVQGGKGPKGAPLRTLVNKANGPHVWGPRAFNNVLGKSGHKGTAEYVGGLNSRLHISAIWTTSVPKMIGNEKQVYGIVEPHILENLSNNLDRHVARILGGA